MSDVFFQIFFDFLKYLLYTETTTIYVVVASIYGVLSSQFIFSVIIAGNRPNLMSVKFENDLLVKRFCIFSTVHMNV